MFGRGNLIPTSLDCSILPSPHSVTVLLRPLTARTVAPVEGARIYNHSANRRPVTPDPLGGALYYNVRAVLFCRDCGGVKQQIKVEWQYESLGLALNLPTQ